MIPPEVLTQHLLALVLVWGWAVVAGYPLAALARFPARWVAAPLLGVAYWAVALYALPFRHGLDCAAAAALLAVAAWLRRPQTPFRFTWPTVTLAVGCASYASLLLTHYVPPGMDASMHATAARLIAERGQLPTDHAPILPELAFPHVNLGLPALAGVAIRSGAAPASALLACEQLTFSLTILALYLLLRVICRATPAAWLAVLSVWGSRGMQSTVNWGGFPTVLGVALGLLATRLLFDLVRRPARADVLPLGLTIGALPLVHGVSAATWLYLMAPAALVYALARPKRVRKAFAPLALAVAVVGLVLAAYVLVGPPKSTAADVAWARSWQAEAAPTGDGWRLAVQTGAYLKTLNGMVAFAGFGGAWLVLLARRRWRACVGLLAVSVLLGLLVINSRVWVLPLSVLLYPERVVFWFTPLAAVALGLAWRARPVAFRRTAVPGVVLVGVLGVVAGQCHYIVYHREACRPRVTRSQWEALEWAAAHLDAERHFVRSTYGTAGSYLPAVAGVPTSGAHLHFFGLARAQAVLAGHRPTHAFLVGASDVAGRIVFANDEVRIVELPTP